MRMEDSIQVRRIDDVTGVVEEILVHNVCYTETEAILADSAGLKESGQVILRLPEGAGLEIECGDQICKAGSNRWYTVTTVRNNQKRGSRLSHRKLICSR